MRWVFSLGTALVVFVSVLAGAAPAVAAEATFPSSTIAAGLDLVGSTTTGLTTSSAALSGAEFNPGYIISDYAFYDDDAMSQAEIQSFLDIKCPTDNCLNAIQTSSNTREASNMCPGAYIGVASEPAAAIIFKVQQSCGISAKALLVTLQKEQSLVTTQNPSALKLKIAMGYGCPDTSVCDSKYFGLFNQIYSAASQLKRYGLRTSDNISFRTKYQIGVPYAIQLHPNAACGTQTVTVQNMATTALYYYTPYTPNAAALGNLGGSGDACSSYGNRNFWVFYNSWFGSSTVEDGAFEIAAAYELAGGAAGVLGAVVGASICPAGATGCVQEYENGTIAWSKGNGAHLLVGAIADYYRSAGSGTSDLGYPTTDMSAIVGAASAGEGQTFQNGQIVTSGSGTYALQSPILAFYSGLGWVRGALGWPASDVVCVVDNCSQAFASGFVSIINGVGQSILSTSNVGAAYLVAGGPAGALGPAITSLNALASVNGAGSGQSFANGQILISEAGAFAVTGDILGFYASKGWVRGSLGWPISNRECEPDGRCVQSFQFNTVEVLAGGTAQIVGVSSSTIAELYASMGGTSSLLGVALSTVNPISSANGDGQGQSFRSGQILSSGDGVFAIYGKIGSYHASHGWVRGVLGWPSGSQICDAQGTCSQAFQGGIVYLPRGGSPFFVAAGSFADAYSAAGGPTGQLGTPQSDSNSITGPRGNGSGQAFANGQILSSESGVYAVYGAFLKSHSANGWVRGTYGWPTGNAICDSGGNCTQAFQGGDVLVPRGGAGYLVELGGILTTYSAAGGSTSALGFPVSAASALSSANGSGRGQAFQGGQILMKAGEVAYAVPAGILSIYGANGWVRGHLGWPISEAVCTAGVCSQSFEFGAISTDGSVTSSATLSKAGGVFTSWGNVTTAAPVAISPHNFPKNHHRVADSFAWLEAR